ncbi:hypothetical protein SO802_002208 [Lithocarpus litseifolius]|uniref:Uncharacterized protein n=1 Tax=Lithocarpus litseifolius TaxID=425828 RepID=A0AAW2DY97_9ROSI
MNYLSRMNLGKTVKKPIVQDLMIPSATPPFGLGYKPIDDDLLEMKVRKKARAKAKAMGLCCPSEPLKPYTSTLNGKFVKTRDSQCYWGFPESSYEERTSDEDEEGGKAPSDDDEGSDAKSDSSSDNSSSDSGHGDDDSNSDSESNNSEYYDSQYSGNDWGEPPSDREDEDEGLYYRDYDDDVDYYDGDIKDNVDDAEAEHIDMRSDDGSDQYRLVNLLEDAGEEIGQANDVDYDDYPYGCLLDWSCINDVSSRSSPRYDKYGREIPKLGSFHNSDLCSLTPHIEEEDYINFRLAILDYKLMVHSLKNMTLESPGGDNEKM